MAARDKERFPKTEKSPSVPGKPAKHVSRSGYEYPVKSPFHRPRVRTEIQEHRGVRLGKTVHGSRTNPNDAIFGEASRVSMPTVYHSVSGGLFRNTLQFKNAGSEMRKRKRRAMRHKAKKIADQYEGSEEESSVTDSSTSSEERETGVEALRKKLRAGAAAPGAITDEIKQELMDHVSIKQENSTPGAESQSDDDGVKRTARRPNNGNDTDDEEPLNEDDVMDSLDPNTWTFSQYARFTSAYTDAAQEAALDLGTRTEVERRTTTAPDDYLSIHAHPRAHKTAAAAPSIPILDHPDLPRRESSELLAALQVYAMELFNALGYRQDRAFLRADETALLALGVLVEEYVREMLGPTGHQSYMQFEEPPQSSREARWRARVDTAAEGGQQQLPVVDATDVESDVNDAPGVNVGVSYDVSGSRTVPEPYRRGLITARKSYAARKHQPNRSGTEKPTTEDRRQSSQDANKEDEEADA